MQHRRRRGRFACSPQAGGLLLAHLPAGQALRQHTHNHRIHNHRTGVCRNMLEHRVAYGQQAGGWLGHYPNSSAHALSAQVTEAMNRQ